MKHCVQIEPVACINSGIRLNQASASGRPQNCNYEIKFQTVWGQSTVEKFTSRTLTSELVSKDRILERTTNTCCSETHLYPPVHSDHVDNRVKMIIVDETKIV